MPIRIIVNASLAVVMAGVCVQGASAAPSAFIAKAIADPMRPAEDRKLDADRKPAAVLAFARVKPGQTVAEYLPGGGYYTRLLSDVVGPSGKVYALETTTWGQENIDATKKVLTESGRANVALDLAPLGGFTLPTTVDVFWTTDNYHDLHVPKYASVDMTAFNKHVFASLKSGGVYLIIDHAAARGTAATLSPTLHRIDEATVIAEVTAAGFTLARQSEILRHPGDDHSRTVFDPAIHFKTDQFVLMFRKP